MATKAKAKVSKQQAQVDEVFAMMEQAIRLNTYESSDLLAMVADLIPTSPVLAASIANHASDYISTDVVDGETTWTDIVVEAYRRALFDIKLSPRYGTGYLVKDIEAVKGFVQHYISQHSMNVATPPSSAVM